MAYYTFHVDGQDQNEAAQFFSTYETTVEIADDLNVLVTWIRAIGQRGARKHYFRQENAAEALPPPARIMAELTTGSCQLRLYCVRLSEQIVTLANGGLKESQSVQGSPALLPKFRFANKMAEQLDQLLLTNDLHIHGKDILNLDDIILFT